MTYYLFQFYRLLYTWSHKRLGYTRGCAVVLKQGRALQLTDTVHTGLKSNTIQNSVPEGHILEYLSPIYDLTHKVNFQTLSDTRGCSMALDLESNMQLINTVPQCRTQ